MPGLRFLFLPAMQRNKRIFQSSRKCTAARNLREFSQRTRLASEPSTPDKEHVQKNSRTIRTFPGSLIHLSQSADGKLLWDPPSSSTSSLSESRAESGYLSAECGPATIVHPALMNSEWVKASGKPWLTQSKESLKAEPASPSSTSCFNCVMAESTIMRSTDIAEYSDVQEVSVGLHQQASSSSELSAPWQLHESGSKGVLINACTPRLSPLLSSKLKPGKHILGVKKHQNYIRPGQLRHWAVGNSPLNLAKLPVASFKGKACRTLAF